MFNDYWKMSDAELTKLARKYNLRNILEETLILTDDRKFDADFVINRKDVINQLSERDTRKLAYYSAVLSIITILISLAYFAVSFLHL